MTNRELLEFTLKVNIGTCNEIYTKINRQLDEKSDIDLALVRYFNTLVSINHKVQDVLYKERENLNIPNPKHLAFTKDGSIEAFKHKRKKILGIMWHPERYKKIKKFDLDFIKKYLWTLLY